MRVTISKAIRKTNAKKIAEIAKNTKTVKVYSLDNNFEGEDITKSFKGPEDIKKFIVSEMLRMRRAKLTQDTPSTVVLTLHSNLWYSFIS